MIQTIDSIRKTRAFALNIIDGLSTEQLNYIPEGFSNNIAWNLGHMIAAQQGICYRRAALPLRVDETFFESYKPGSKPEHLISEAAIEEIKALAFSTIDQLQEDYQSGLFANYVPWTTRYGVEMKTAEDAIQFLSYHEGMHTGYIMALKRMLSLQLA